VVSAWKGNKITPISLVLRDFFTTKKQGVDGVIGHLH
jgi:hypothetical protein